MTRKLMFLLPSYAGGGAERVMITLANSVDRSSYSPSLLTLADEGPLRDMVAEDVSCASLGTARLSRALLPLAGRIRAARPDILVTTMGYMNLTVSGLRWLLPRKIRLVLREANMPEVTIRASGRPKLAAWGYGALYPGADAVLCNSSRVRDALVALGIGEAQVSILNNPVPVAEIRSQVSGIARPGDHLRLVAAGRLSHQKGFDRLIDWMGALPEMARLDIFGDGSERQALQQRIDAAGLGDRVRLAGFTDELWREIAAAHAFVMPSRWEGMPNAALEALACGTRVIATPESGGLAELLDQVTPGALSILPAGDAFVAGLQDLAAGIEVPLGDPERGYLPQDHTQAAVVARFENILNRLR